MTDEPDRRAPSRASAQRGRRFKPHQLELEGGGALVLGTDGAISHLDPAGTTIRVWLADDPEWADQALRFGLRPQAPTVSPTSRGVLGTTPPRR
jgi:hypothetical protein